MSHFYRVLTSGTRITLLFLAIASTALFGGCAIYAPTLPTTPILEKGQGEITVGTRSLTSVELTAAYAPTQHLLVVVESAFRSGKETRDDQSGHTENYDYHRQGSIGLGYYRAPTATHRAYLAAVGGIGFASASLYAIDFEAASPWFPFPLPVDGGHYQAQYRRYYGQFYVAWPSEKSLTSGVSLRGSFADYSHLTFDDYPISPTNRVFVEPTFFLRFGRGAIRGQANLGFSIPVSGNSDNPYNKRTAPFSSLIGASVIFRPDLLKKRE